MHVDRMLVHWLWRQLNLDLKRSPLPPEAKQRARDRLDEEIHEYETACMMTLVGSSKERGDYWKEAAAYRRMKLMRRLER